MVTSGDGNSFIVSQWRKLLTSPMTPRIGIALGCFILILAVTITQLANPRSLTPVEGDVARMDYVAPFSSIYTDTEETEAAREAAANDVDPVYTIDNKVFPAINADLGTFFLQLDDYVTGLIDLRAAFESQAALDDQPAPDGVESEPVDPPPFITQEDIDNLETVSVTTLIGILDESIEIESYLVERVTNEDIRDLFNKDADTRNEFHGMIERAIRERAIDTIFQSDLARVLDELRETIVERSIESGFTQEQGTLAYQIASYYVRPNAILDVPATSEAKRIARESTLPVQKEVRAGQVFLRSRDVVDREHIDIMEALRLTDDDDQSNSWLSILLFTLMLATAFTLGSQYLVRWGTNQLEDLRYYMLFFTILTIAYLASFFLIQRISAVASGNDAPVLLMLVSLPVVGAAVLLAHYFRRLLAATVSGFLAVIVTLASGEPSVLLPALFPSLAASLIVWRDSPRAMMARAIILLTLIWAASFLAQIFTSGMDTAGLQARPWILFFAVTPVLVAMFLANYVLDSAFNIPTASRLAEFDNQDHPLLRKLQLEAPGTWHHSMMVGLIAEAACQAVGGNSYLVRVACMYHDIGKVRRPEFFIENQHGGMNVHDKYSPWLSKIIVESHVKDGIALAEAHGLPKELIDFIPQHHGTSLIQYFFRKALAMSEDGYVNEYDYRYPGPKPQTLETACLNIADAAESSTRSLDDPTPHRIESLINKIYEDRLLDGQFEECGLALSDLEKIKDTIIDRLIGSYHARIEYPEEEELRRQFQLKRAEGEKAPKNGIPPSDDD